MYNRLQSQVYFQEIFVFSNTDNTKQNVFDSKKKKKEKKKQ